MASVSAQSRSCVVLGLGQENEVNDNGGAHVHGAVNVQVGAYGDGLDS